MHLIAHRLQIPVAAAVHDERPVTSAEQVSEELVSPVEPAGVSTQKPFHSCDQIGLRRLNHQMKMIWHQTIGMDLPVRLAAGITESFEETSPVKVVEEDRFASVTAIHHDSRRRIIGLPRVGK